MAKPFTLELYHQALALGEQLQKNFPKCFFPIGQEKPLKAGIFHDLAARSHELSPSPDKKVIRAFMVIYTTSISYRAALLAPNAIRIDLEGNEGDAITIQERYRAKVTTLSVKWALDTEGYEAERAQAKSKLKEQQQKSEEIKKQESGSPENKESSPKQLVKAANSVFLKQPPVQTTTPQKIVPVVIKKRKIILPEKPKAN